MPFDVEMPDGTIISDVPDGTTKEQVLAKYNASKGVQQPSKGLLDLLPKGVPQWMQSKPGQGWDDANAPVAGGDVTNPMAYLSEAQKTEQGTAMQAVGQGVQKGVQVGAGIAKGAVINPVAAVAQVTGESGRKFAEEAQKAYEQQRKTAGSTGFDAAELVGSLVSPVNKLIPGGPVAGAVVGSVLNPVTGENLSELDVLRGKLEQGTVGALFGTATKAALPAFRDGARKLLDAGADLQPGQAFGGVAGSIMQTAEGLRDTLMKLVGRDVSADKVNKAFTYVTLNEALAPIGKTIGASGDDGFSLVQKGLKMASNAYTEAFNKVGKVAADDAFKVAMNNVKNTAKNTLDPADYRKFEKELTNNVLKRFEGDALSIDGQQLHNIKRYLQARLENLSNATDELGVARKGLFDNVMDEFKNYTYRVDSSGAIKAADTTWSNMYRVAGAAKKAATSSGNFSPEQLATTAASQTTTLVGGAGAGPLQKYADQALKILGKDKTQNITPSDLKNIGVASGLGYTGLYNPVFLGVAGLFGLSAEALGKLALKNPDLYNKIRDEAMKNTGLLSKAIGTPSQAQPQE